MEESSQDYTAFSTPFGSFKWLRMPMGLTGARRLSNVWSKSSCWSNLENLCALSRRYYHIFVNTRRTPPTIATCFRTIPCTQVKINPEKCDFFRMKVQFLGHIVSKDGLEVDPSKIEAVQKFPVPRSQTEVKSFLGLASYYRRFVPKFAEIARPLHKASETSTKFEWTPEAQDAFESLKLKLTSTPILAFPCLKEPFIIHTDASQFAIGAVLAQVQDGKERAICYASKSLSKSQTKYSATRRELLALVTFTRHFRHYLLGQKFTIVTDHSALQWLHSFKDPDGITARWLEKLAPFDYEVRHRPGKSIGHADGLSRIPPNSINAIETHLPSTSTQNEIPKVATGINNYQEVIGNVFDSKDSIAHCVSADFEMSAGIARHFKRKFPTKYPSDLDHSYTPLWPQRLPETRRYLYHLVTKQKYFNKPTYSTLRASLERMRTHAENNGIPRISMPCIGTGLDQLDWDKVKLLIQETFRTSPVQVVVYILPDLPTKHGDSPVENETSSKFAQAQEADESLKHVRHWVRQKIIPTQNDLQGLPRLAWQMYNQLSSLYIQDDILCRKFEPTNGRLAYLQQIVPPSLVTEIITSLHNSVTAGHLDAYKTLEKIRQRYYWPGFKTDVKHHILRCDKCQKRSGPPQKHRHSLVDWKISYPFHHIGLDFLGPLPTSNGCRYILLIGDHFTKWYEAIPLPDQTAATTSDALLERWICRFGCPYSIHTDRGTNFESQLFANLLKKLEIDKTRTTAFHPQSNSVIERMNRTLLNMLAKCIDEDQTNWSVKLPYVLLAYRSSVHESTGFTPQYLVFGHEISLPLDLMYRPPPSTTPVDVNDWVSQKEEAFRQAYELVRRNATSQQRRRNNLYNKRVHGPTYKEGEYVLLHYPVVPVGKSPKLSSPWRGPYEISKCLNDVNYKIKELTTGKVQVVHYDRMKRYHGPIPVASNVQTRKTTPIAGHQTPPVPDFDHSQCGQPFIPYHFVPQMRSPSPSNRPASPLPSPNPITDHFPNRSPSATPPPLPSARRRSLPLPTRSFDHERHTPPPVSAEPRPSSSPRKLQSPTPSPKKTTFVQSPSRLDSLIDGASRNLRQRLYSSPQSNSPATLRASLNKSFDIHAPPSTNSSTSRSLRSNTKQQRKAQPLFKAKLPRDLTEFLSPKKKPRTNRQL